MTRLQATNTFTTITLTWQPPPVPNGVIIMYQVTYSTDEVVNSYKSTIPTVTVTGLLPNTTYTFSITGSTMTGIGTPQQVQSSTAAIREFMHIYLYSALNDFFTLCILLTCLSADVTGVMVSAITATSIRVSWLAVYLPSDGYLTGYTVYYRSLPNTSDSQSEGYTSQACSPRTTSGDINDLNPDDVYQFSVVAEVAIIGHSYSGKVDALAFKYSTNCSCLQLS